MATEKTVNKVLLGAIPALLSILISLLVYIWIDHKQTQRKSEDTTTLILNKLVDKVNLNENKGINHSTRLLNVETATTSNTDRIRKAEEDIIHLKPRL